jgi:hypothetical protein
MLIGLIIGIVAFVLDGQLAYFTAGHSLDLLRGMTGIEPAMITAVSLTLMTGIAAALGRFLYSNR